MYFRQQHNIINSFRPILFTFIQPLSGNTKIGLHRQCKMIIMKVFGKTP